MAETQKFRSKFEKTLFKEARENGQVEYEPKHPAIHYTRPAKYLPDFRLDSGVLVEAKGYFTGRDRTKMLRVRAENPGLDIRLVFQRANNKLTKSPNSITYGEWADKHGFVWSEGTIPKGWFKRNDED